MAKNIFLHILIFICFPLALRGGDRDIVQERKITVSGHIKDASNDEPLTGVTIADTKNKTGTTTDFRGSYSIVLPEGSY